MDGEQYSMGIHGFAKLSVFSVSQNDGKLSFTLTESPETLSQYPRKFCFMVEYSLDGRRLNIRFEVVNRDDRAMYFGLGGHPGINVPLKAGLDFSDYRIRFDAPCSPERVIFSDKGLRTGEQPAYTLEGGGMSTAP